MSNTLEPTFNTGKYFNFDIEMRKQIVNKSNTISSSLHQSLHNSYVPPLNASIEIVAPIQTEQQSKLNLIAAGLTTISKIPLTFTWQSYKDVNKYKGWQTSRTFLQEPINQYSCGLCWAISSASMLGDRFAIFSRAINPGLSPTYIASCMKGSLKCQGGFPAKAGKFLEKTGTVQDSCWDYSWCTNSKNICVDGLPGSSVLIPTCKSVCQYDCVPRIGCKMLRGNLFHFKAKKESTQSIVNINSIKLEILNFGPVVSVYRVFDDFILGSTGSTPDYWKKTKGIYINAQGMDIYGYQKNGKSLPSETFKGNHAVVIVGWGIEHDIPNPISANPPTISVPYWIIRNSWGKKWNGNGYFKMAISNKKNKFNMQCALDRGLIINGIKIGGVTTFHPDIPMASANTPQIFVLPPAMVLRYGSFYENVKYVFIFIVFFFIIKYFRVSKEICDKHKILIIFILFIYMYLILNHF
jgi:hypothetical protein